MMKTRSVASPPSWNPKLPPPTVNIDGGPQCPVPPRRQTSAPRPKLPPTPSANFISDGITPTHTALSNRFCGIAFSGVPMTSFSTLAALCSRSASLVFSAASAPAQVVRQTKMLTSFLIFGLLVVGCGGKPLGPLGRRGWRSRAFHLLPFCFSNAAFFLPTFSVEPLQLRFLGSSRTKCVLLLTGDAPLSQRQASLLLNQRASL